MTSALSTERRNVDRVSFAVGMYALAENACRQISEDTIEVFFKQLASEMTADEWRAVVQRALEETTGRNPWNTIGDLLRILHTLRREQAPAPGERPPDEELRELEEQADAEAGRRSAA